MLFDVVKVLTRNGLAVNGCESSSNHSDGNFCEIVYLLSRHNPVMKMKSWLENSSSRKYQTTYMSPQSQNELIKLLGEEIRAIVSDKVNQSGCCSVMADTTLDVSHSDELSVAVRFVDSEILEPEERLVRVSELTNDKTGEGQLGEGHCQVIGAFQHSFINYPVLNIRPHGKYVWGARQ